MRWRAVNPYTIRSDCGRWQISRSGEAGSVRERFSVWRRDSDSGACTLASVERTAELAKSRAAESAGKPAPTGASHA